MTMCLAVLQLPLVLPNEYVAKRRHTYHSVSTLLREYKSCYCIVCVMHACNVVSSTAYSRYIVTDAHTDNGVANITAPLL